MSFEGRWSNRTIGDGEWVRVDFGDLRLIVMNVWEEWRVARLMAEGADVPVSGVVANLPQGLDWERWDHSPGDVNICFRPTFPVMPVVARPYSVLNVSPKGSVSLFFGIPMWVEVMAEFGKQMLPLVAFPTEELSKTWHGNHLAGHLGYALRTYARRAFVADEWPDHDIVCPIDIVNIGEKMLPFNRLYLETDHLAVYELDGRLWANAARIRVGGDEAELSDITYASRPVKPYENAVEVTPPRMGRARRSTMRSAFNRVLEQINPLHE